MRSDDRVRALEQRMSELWSDLSNAVAHLPRLVDGEVFYPGLPKKEEVNLPEGGWAKVLEDLDRRSRSRFDWERVVTRGTQHGDDFDDVADPSHREVWSQDYYLLLRLLELSTQLVEEVERRDLEALQETWTHLNYCACQGYYGDDIAPETRRESIRTLLDSIYEEQPRELFRVQPPEVSARRPTLIVNFSKELGRRILRKPDLLYSISPRVYEELVADVWSMFGYRVELTAPTWDGGRDIIAVASRHDVLEKLIIECKRYSKKRKIGVGEVRALYGVKELEGATKALLATTAFFTRSARALEKQVIYELELKDYNAVMGWVQEYVHLMKALRSDA